MLKLFIVLFTFCCTACLAEKRKTTCSPKIRADYENNWPLGLDFGVYWQGPNNTFVKGGTTTPAAYDSKKPTVIFFHGWEGIFGGSTSNCFRPDRYCEPCYDRVDFVSAWLQKGWNVGYFLWEQFADEHCVRDCEYKIWQPDEKLRWRSNDCNGPNYVGKLEYHTYDDTPRSVSDLCVENLRRVMVDFSGAEIRFVGESLGAQLAAKCAELAYTQGVFSAPARIVMLEPAYSHSGLAGKLQCETLINDRDFGKKAVDLTNAAIEKLKEYQVTTEVYTSGSQFLEWLLDADPKLNFEFHVHYNPQWCSTPGRFFEYSSYNTAGCYHNSIVTLYFLSMQAPTLPPDGLSRELSPQCRVPSAASTYEEIRHLKQNCAFGAGVPHFTQSEGKHTLTTSDDKFTVDVAGSAGISRSLVQRWMITNFPKAHAHWFTSLGLVMSLVVGVAFVLIVAKARQRYHRSTNVREAYALNCETNDLAVNESGDDELE